MMLKVNKNHREGLARAALNHFAQDARFAVRAALHNPLSSSIVVFTLAIAIGVNTAVFSVVHALLLNPYPFPHSDLIVSLEARHVSGKNKNTGYRDFLDWQQQSTAFSAMAITPSTRGYTLMVGGEPQRVIGGATTSEFLSVLGLQPVIGRFFTADEDRPGAPLVAVLTYSAWKKRFDSDPRVLGRAIQLDGQSFTILGILPKHFVFRGIEPVEFLCPLRERPWQGRYQHQYGVVARLREGITVQRAQGEMTVIARHLEQQYPATNTGWGITVQTIRAAFARETRMPVIVLFSAVGFVLLLACVNVSGLLLARAASRAKEMAIRLSLGASPIGIIRQLVLESSLLSLAGGTSGIALTIWLMRVVSAVAPETLDLKATLYANTPVLVFMVAVSLATGLLAGLLPAWNLSKVNANSILKDDRHTWSGGRSRARLMSYLVTTEVALTVALMCTAGLLIKSFLMIVHVPTGVEAEHVLTFGLNLPDTRFSGTQAANFYAELLNRMGNSGDVTTAAAVSSLPMTGKMGGGSFQVDGRAKASDWVDTLVQYSSCTPSYFRTMGIPILRGRDFDQRDTETSLPVGIVNDTLVRQFFANQDPIGHRYWDAYNGKWRTIVGVAASVSYQQPNRSSLPGVYAPLTQAPSNLMWITVRARGDASQLTGTARSIVRSFDQTLPLLEVRTMPQLISDSLSVPRLVMSSIAGFAGFGLFLAAMGIYSIVDYSIRQRTHEMGIRLALGASVGGLQVLQLRKGAWPAVLGVILGIPGALVISSVLKSLLFGTGPQDLTVFIGAPMLLLLVAFGASLLPARKVSKVNPIDALRSE